MTKPIFLKYGSEQIPFNLPDNAQVLQINHPEIKINPTKFASGLSLAFQDLNPQTTNIAIIVADKTRLCEYETYLPVLLKTLEDFGATPDNIKIFIAYGTHLPQTDKESIAVYGKTYSDYSFIHHNCDNKKLFKKLGQTTQNTPVYIRHDIIEANFLITFGPISHHYFAGYGGGPKLLFPGLGLRESIYHNHSLFLDKENKQLSAYCMSGVLDKNPVAQDLAEIETFRPADLAIHAVLNSKGNVSDLLVGKGMQHFLNACLEHGKNCEKKVGKKYDLVIGSCGGYPKDINFIQTHKAIDNAAGFVKDNGNLIIFAKCSQGVGSETFLKWFELEKQNKAFSRLAQNYQGNGGTALSMISKSKRINIFMVTDLSDSIVETMGIKKISIKQAKELVLQHGSGHIAAVIPNASLLVGVKCQHIVNPKNLSCENIK